MCENVADPFMFIFYHIIVIKSSVVRVQEWLYTRQVRQRVSIFDCDNDSDDDDDDKEDPDDETDDEGEVAAGVGGRGADHGVGGGGGAHNSGGAAARARGPGGGRGRGGSWRWCRWCWGVIKPGSQSNIITFIYNYVSRILESI